MLKIESTDPEDIIIELVRINDRVIVLIDGEFVAGFKDDGAAYLWEKGTNKNIDSRWKE